MVSKIIKLSSKYDADYFISDKSIFGEIYHVNRNLLGSGCTQTPIARYYGTRPEFIEGFHPHWSIHCYVRIHKLSPSPEKIAPLLVSALLSNSIIEKPIWLSWHKEEELGGTDFGEVFEED